MSFRQFIEDMPWWIIKEECELLDEKEGDMKQFIGYEESSMFKNLLRLFGKKDS